MKLVSILDTDFLAEEVRTGFVSCSVHPDDPMLKLLCYGKLTQIQGHWNEVTKQCRGMIVRSSSEDFADAEVVARPWRKFFTLQQLESGWALGDEEEGTTIESDIAALDFDAPAEVTDKVDGSMLVLYRHPDGLPAVSTKGSFVSEQAILYTKLLRAGSAYSAAAEQMLTEFPGTTFIFEGVGPSNQIVLWYPKDEIVFLGAIDNQTGAYLSTQSFRSVWADNGLTCCDQMPARNLGEAIRMADRQNKEGVVVRILSEDPAKVMQIKVKQQDYLALHRLVAGFGEAAVREAITKAVVDFADLARVAAAGSSLEIPEIRFVVEFNDNPIFQNVRDTRREQFDAAVVPCAVAATSALAYVEGLPEEYFSGDPIAAKKRFALDIRKAVEQTGAPQGVLYTLATARIAGKPLESLNASSVMLAAAKTVKHSTAEPE